MSRRSASPLAGRRGRSLAALAEVLIPSGDGLPGAADVEVGPAIARRAEEWSPAVAGRVGRLVDAWEWLPLFSAHHRPYSALDLAARTDWVESSYRSRSAARRLMVAALKQLVFLVWASSPEVEDALGYDYRCRRDDEPHGAGRPISGAPLAQAFPPEPRDYARPGPAMSEGTLPEERISLRTFRPVAPQESAMTTISFPAIDDGFVDRVDAVVVGSGAGGAVVAAHLAEGGLDVAVIEEGPHVTDENFAGPAFDRFQRFCRDNGMTQVWGRPPIPLPLGRVVGGTTVVNSGTCFRAPNRVLRRWSQEFGVDTDDLAEHYLEVEDFLNVRPVPWELLGPNGMAAHRGAVALGYSGGPLLRNIADCHGCGQCAFGCPTNAKQAMHVSYLPRAVRAGARIYSSCRVDRITLDEERASGVTGTILSTEGARRGRFTVAARHVFVCAGAIHTPGLLQRSALRDPSGQLGRNLRIHPATGVGGFFADDVVNWKGTLQSYYIDQFFDSHEIMLEATTTIPSIGAGSLPGIGRQAVDELGAFRKLATLGFYVSDTSTGRVRALPRGETLATYRMNELDAHRMAVGVAIAAEVLLEAGAKRVLPGIPGMEAISAREDLQQLRERRIRPQHLRLTAFHPMGTARMGADPQRCVVDSHGRHHATANLWIADASIFPSCVAVNPQMTIMAFAKRSAEKLLALEGRS